MSDVWYYAEGEKTVGPVKLAELTAILSRVSIAKEVLIWRTGLADWVKAENVQELAPYLISPPPLPTQDTTDVTQEGETKNEKPVVKNWVQAVRACIVIGMIVAFVIFDRQTGWSQQQLEHLAAWLHSTTTSLEAKQIELDQRVDQECRELRERKRREAIAPSGARPLQSANDAVDLVAEKGCVDFYARKRRD